MKTEKKIFNYIKSNQEHTTLVGKMITVNHSDNEDDDAKIMEFAEWMTDFVKKADNFAENKVSEKK